MNNDQVSSGVLFVFGLAVCLRSIHYELGTLSAPESGLMPFLTGAAISSFSGAGFVHATIKSRRGEGWASLLKGLHLKRPLIILASLASYIVLLKPLGFFLCTAAFMGFLLRAIVAQRWPVVIGVALLTAIASYLIFEIWLKAQLPIGPWGI